MLSLFLFGMALCRLRERSGTLFLGMGVHAGSVFAIEMYRDVFHAVASGSPWIYGGTRLHDGVVGTLAVALLFWVAARARAPEDSTVRAPATLA